MMINMFLAAIFVCAGALAAYGGVLVGVMLVPWGCGTAIQQQDASMVLASNAMHRGVKCLLPGLAVMGLVGLAMHLSGAI